MCLQGRFQRISLAAVAVCVVLFSVLAASQIAIVRRSGTDVNQKTVISEDEKIRIRAEEIFREEVRQEMAVEKAAHSPGSRLWALANSSFVLWFLSSVVVGGLTAAVAMYQRSHATQAQKAEITRRLNTEISSRIAEGLVALHLDLKRIANGQVFFASGVYNEALSYLDNKVTDEARTLDFSIYPEYRWRSIRSLIFELSGVAEQSAVAALRDAKAAHTLLVELADEAALNEANSNGPDMSVSGGAVKKSTEILEHMQANSFWQAQLR